MLSPVSYENCESFFGLKGLHRWYLLAKITHIDIDVKGATIDVYQRGDGTMKIAFASNQK